MADELFSYVYRQALSKNNISSLSSYSTLLLDPSLEIVGCIGAASAGLEGPLVHIGSCIAFLLGKGGPDNHRLKWRWLKYFDNDRDRRDLITCGFAAGVCATFFSTAVVVVVLRAFMEYCNSENCGLFGKGGLIMFHVSDATVTYHAMDLIPVALIGVIGGVLGSLYNYLLHKVLIVYNLINAYSSCDASLSESTCSTTGRTGSFKQFNCPPGCYNDLASLFHSASNDAVCNICSTSTPSEFHPISLLIYFAVYLILGLFTFGIAVPSSHFLAIILMGAAYGRLLGIFMGSYTKINQGLYVVLGAASLTAGSMRMNVSLCVIFLELTNNLLLLPITMFILLIAKAVEDCFNSSVYEIILHLKGLPFLDVHLEPWIRNLTEELIDAKPALVTLCGEEKVSRIVEVLKNTTHNGFPVVDQGFSHQ
ncbi:hypothetical protein GIB67_040888 [Kingdonia uniflora]|uniref:Uncharacterized protein n=1 Tax=Kingdonia uniflora TaxID=39325 RepID=A0A7J7L7Y4_9MAGN|nr:hypothetical protein GIB67_040888 [Kingdonia uniflora]